MAYQFVRVLWNDAWMDATEPKTVADITAEHKPLVVESFGWLIIDDEMGVSLASERYLDNNEHDVFRAKTFIPRAMIRPNGVIPVNLTKKRAKKLLTQGTADATPKPPAIPYAGKIGD